MISIYRKKDNEVMTIFTTPINSGCMRKCMLMQEDYSTLKFSLHNPLNLQIGDYILDNRFGHFELTDVYKPTYNNSTGGYDYDVIFNASYIKWKNKIFKYAPELGVFETSWELTASLVSHLTIFINNLNFLQYKHRTADTEIAYTFEIDSTVDTSAKYISYDNISLFDALSLMAETWKCEWWVEEHIIHFGRCQRNTEILFESGKNITTMAPSNSASTYATRLIAFGSDKNLPKNYRPIDSEVILNGVVQRRLMLPEGTPYIDAEPDLTTEQAVEVVKMYDEIFPKFDGKISNVYTRTETVEEEDHTREVTYYLIEDNSFTFSESYILDTLEVKFESGTLSGMKFGATFIPEEQAKLLIGKEVQLFEVVVNKEYGRELPDNILHPEIGDSYVLLGWDSTKIEDLGLVEKAELELLQRAEKDIKQMMQDPNTYNCELHYLDAKKVYQSGGLYNLGDSVRLVDRNLFADGYRDSRIVGYEYKLDIPWDNPVFMVGETVAATRLGQIESDINKIIIGGVKTAYSSGNSVYVIGRNDKTRPTDSNVFSALRTQQDYLRKNEEDTAIKKITFEDGLTALNAIIKEYLSSPLFVNGFNGQGFKLWLDELGLSHLEIDQLTVRQIMTVFELVISRIRAVGGQIVVSAANGKIKAVEDTGDAYRITFEGDNYFTAHDLMRCQVFTGVTDEEGTQSPIRGYWVEVLAVDGNSILIQKTEFDEWGTEPLASDECVLMGNTENELRQNFISISATEDGQPRVDVMDNVNSKSLAGCLRARFGNLDNIHDEAFGDNQPHGDGLYSDNAYLKGEFILTTGENVKTQFKVQEGLIKSSVETLQVSKGILYNGTFTKGLSGWLSGNEAQYLSYNNTPLVIGDDFLGVKTSMVALSQYQDARFTMLVNDSNIKQQHIRFALPEALENTKAVPTTFEIEYKCHTKSFVYACLKGVTNNDAINASYDVTPMSYFEGDTVSLLNHDGTKCYDFDFINYDVDDDDIICAVEYDENNISLYNLTKGQVLATNGYVSMGQGEPLFNKMTMLCAFVGEPSDSFKKQKFTSRWNGEGDFELYSVGGTTEFYSLDLSVSDTEARYATLFEQTDKLVKIAAKQFDEDGNVKQESEIFVKPDSAGIITQDDQGNVASIGTFEQKDGKFVVELTGDQIRLKGNLTVDGNFKVRDDGSIEARHALFYGFTQLGTMYVNDSNYTTFYKDVTSLAWHANIINSAPIIILEHTNIPTGAIVLSLPGIDKITTSGGNATRNELELVRGYIGSSVLIYNYLDKDIQLSGYKSDGYGHSTTLAKGKFVKMDCKLGFIPGLNELSGEFIYWEIDIEGIAIKMANK